eukprot:m.75320 g.75320  ORF g.75320 m.75320 type:complete len:711 (-) comp12447_c2_seq1:118-2250(-)
MGCDQQNGCAHMPMVVTCARRWAHTQNLDAQHRAENTGIHPYHQFLAQMVRRRATRTGQASLFYPRHAPSIEGEPQLSVAHAIRCLAQSTTLTQRTLLCASTDETAEPMSRLTAELPTSTETVALTSMTTHVVSADVVPGDTAAVVGQQQSTQSTKSSLANASIAKPTDGEVGEDVVGFSTSNPDFTTPTPGMTQQAAPLPHEATPLQPTPLQAHLTSPPQVRAEASPFVASHLAFGAPSPDALALLRRLQGSPSERAVPSTITHGQHILESTTQARSLFERLDKDNSGTVTLKNLQHEIYELHPRSDKLDFAETIFDHMDEAVDPEAGMTFSQFQGYYQERRRVAQGIFDKIDSAKDGRLQQSEILHVAETSGLDYNENDVKRMISMLDADNRGSVTTKEFQTFVALTPSSKITEVLELWYKASLKYETQEQPAMQTSRNWRKAIIHGGIAGFVSRTVTAPMDRLKMILQARAAEEQMTIRQGIRHMVQEGGGIQCMWRGNLANCLKITPESMIRFPVWEQAKKWFYTDFEHKQSTMPQRFAAGASAGVVAQFVVFPLEVIKTRLATAETGTYRNIFDCARKIYHHEGIFKFYRGLLPAMLGIIPYAGIDFGLFDTLKSKYISDNRKSPLKIVAFGMVSSSCSQLASYPLALLRTRLQHDPANKNTLYQEFRVVVDCSGYRGLYRGLTANFLKVVPSVAITYLVYHMLE